MAEGEEGKNHCFVFVAVVCVCICGLIEVYFVCVSV